MDRTVIGNISLSLDGRVTGPGGEYDMGWIVPHALTDESRAHLLKITSTASTALLGRKNYQGFAGFWPAVAGDESADPRDRAFARWLNEAEKLVVSRTLTEASWPGSRVVADDPAEVVGGCGRRRAVTSSSWPARASSAACSRPASSTGSASPCARSWSERGPGCSATARRARRGR
jgi:dihydrofolate reductase